MSNKEILLWMTMKNITQVEFIQNRPKLGYKSLEQFFEINKNILNKKNIEALFYSNSFKEILWDNYLYYYVVSDVINFYNDYLSLDKNIKNIYKLNKDIKNDVKEKLSVLSFQKEKQFDNIAWWLFSFDLLPEVVSYTKKFNNYISDVESCNSKKYHLNNINPLLLHWASFLGKSYLLWCFLEKILHNIIDWKKVTLKKWISNIVLESNYVIDKPSVSFNLKETPISLDDFAYNIKKNFDVVWFLDKDIVKNISDTFNEEISFNKKVKIWKLIKFLSWNDSNKLWLMEEILKSYEFDSLVIKLKQKENIVKCFNLLKKDVKKLSLQDIPDNIFLNKNFEFFLNDHEKNSYKNILDQHNDKKLHYINLLKSKVRLIESWSKFLYFLEIIKKINSQKNNNKIILNSSEMEMLKDKEGNFIDYWYDSVLIKKVNEYLTKLNDDILKWIFSDSYLNDLYKISLLWYVRSYKLFQKWKTIVNVTEKWQYSIWLYNLNNLFTKLEWVWYFDLAINFHKKEELKWIKFFFTTLWENIVNDEYFKKTRIPVANRFKNNTFNDKLIKFLNSISHDITYYDNYLSCVDNSYFYMKKISKETLYKHKILLSDDIAYDKYDDEYYFISEWDISLILSNKQLVDIAGIKDNELDINKYDYKIEYIDKDTKKVIPNNEINKTNANLYDKRILIWEINKSTWRLSDFISLWTNIDHFSDRSDKWLNKILVAFYRMYFTDIFKKDNYLNLYNWLIIYDLETVWFTGNILLWYFILITRDFLWIYKYSNSEYNNFFDYYTVDQNIDLEDWIIKKITDSWYCLSWHNIQFFDNKKLLEEVNNLEIKEKLDKESLDTLSILEDHWLWKMWLDIISKLNFDFWKNINKHFWWWLMESMNHIINLIKNWNHEDIKKNYWKIKQFVTYNKNDAIMSMWLIWQLLKHKTIRTPKGICNIQNLWNYLTDYVKK